jgi:hypothetical protein
MAVQERSASGRLSRNAGNQELSVGNFEAETLDDE